jgi:hypothetical protein
MKTLKNLALAGFASLAMLANAGCSAHIFNKTDHSIDYLAHQLSLQAGPGGYKASSVPKKWQTIPVHPDDAGFLHGDTTTDINDISYDGGAGRFAFGMGWGHKTDSHNTRLMAGVEISGCGEFYGFETKRQASDIRPGDSCSKVYSNLGVCGNTFAPYIGLETIINKNFYLGASAALAGYDIDAEAGHARFGAHEPVFKDSIKAIGGRYYVSAGYVLSSPFEDEKILSFEDTLPNIGFIASAFAGNYQGDIDGEKLKLQDKGLLFGISWIF